MSLIDNKQSILVKDQFPDFVREDYPTFIRFMEAYYEFLENKLENQKNDLNRQARKFYTISDIDVNLDEFEEYFFKTFLELFPRDTLASKALLIKNSIPLYLSKGNERAVKYFFRSLFDEEVDIEIPRNNVLVASGGNWKITKVLRSFQQVYSRYIAGTSKFDGVASNTSFYLPQEATLEDTRVYVNNQLQTVNFWQLENAVYSGKSFRLPYANPRQIYFRPNGLELYVLEDFTNVLYKHTLSDDWNIQSISTTSVDSLSIVPLIQSIGGGAALYGLSFKPEGDKFYVLDQTSHDNRVFEFNLTETWNLQTAFVGTDYFANLTSITGGSTQINAPRDVKFDTTGTIMYVTEASSTAGNKALQYTLSTPWSVNTATYSGTSFSLSGLSPSGLHFNADGSSYFLTDFFTESVRKYRMNTPWNISTSVLETTFVPNRGETDSYMLAVKPEGDILYYGGTSTDTVFQFNLGPDYYIQKEYKKIVFPKPLTNGSEVKIFFDNFNPELLVNRKITGNASGATAIVEAALSYNNEGSDIFEYEVDDKTIKDQFINGEDFNADILSPSEDIVNVFLPGYSGLQKIRIIDEGSSYNVGDPVILIGGDFIESACVAVSKVFSGILNTVKINYGGAGFLAGFPINVSNIGSAIINSAIVEVDKTGANTPNSYTFNTDLIWDAVNVNIGTAAVNSANFKQNALFRSSRTSSPNVATPMINAFSYSTITDIGSIVDAIILNTNARTNVAAFLIADALSANVKINSSLNAISPFFPIESMGSIGRVEILNKGSAYKIGDKLRFDNIPGLSTGIGCRAAVTGIDASGGITSVEFQPASPSSNCSDVSITRGSATITGNNTNFLIDGFFTGSEVMVFNQRRTIATNGVVSNTEITVTNPFTATVSNTEIGLFRAYPIGGQGYDPSYFPTVSVESTTGLGAEIVVTALMGDGERLSIESDKKPGGIEEVQIIDKGIGYKVKPVVLMNDYGDRNAILEADINNSYFEYDGRYLNNDSHLSSEKKLQDSRLFNTGSYILKTRQQFLRFKESFLKLLHPAGTVVFCEFTPGENLIYDKDLSKNEIKTEIQFSTP